MAMYRGYSNLKQKVGVAIARLVSDAILLALNP